MKKMFACKCLLLCLALAFCLPATAGAREREIVFKNATSRHIQFAMIHKDASGKWMKSGWYEIGPRGSYTFEDFFGGDRLYVYATDKNSGYSWPDQSKKQDLQQTVQDGAFYSSDSTRFANAVYFRKVVIGTYAKYTWTFQ